MADDIHDTIRKIMNDTEPESDVLRLRYGRAGARGAHATAGRHLIQRQSRCLRKRLCG